MKISESMMFVLCLKLDVAPWKSKNITVLSIERVKAGYKITGIYSTQQKSDNFKMDHAEFEIVL